MKGKLVLVRYGENFRGVKVLLAQEHGAAGLILYSDPMDDGYFKGDVYPKGPYRPSNRRAARRCALHVPLSRRSHDPGAASLTTLPATQRTDPPKATSLPSDSGDPTVVRRCDADPAAPRRPGIAALLAGRVAVHLSLGPGPVRVHLKMEIEYEYRTIWDVIGTIKGTEYPNDMVISGNHRDAWVYGAADPGSGTAAQLEAVRGIGQLLKSGWRPKRTIVFASWDAEEEGMVGSTEWAEEHAKELTGRGGVLQYGCRGERPEFCGRIGPEPEAVHARRREERAQPAGRQRV